MSDRVRIHIDQKLYDSPNPTSGVDLYELAHVKEGRVLYKEVSGDHEDKLVRIDAEIIHLVEDEHFHSGDAPANYFVIEVNTDPFVLRHEVVSFDQVVKLAYPQPPSGLDPEFTVSFEHAASQPHHGDLPEGAKVTVKHHGTTFDVTHTNRS